jgi:hypothetical protein
MMGWLGSGLSWMSVGGQSKFVKPHLKNHKNDMADAEEAASRLTMRLSK